jgi:integrase
MWRQGGAGMSLFLQDNTWWYEFTIGGHRYRSSTRTTDKERALSVEAEHRASIKLTGKRASPTLDRVKIACADERRAKRWLQAGIETKRHVIQKPQVPKAGTNIFPGSTLLEACEFILGLGSLRWAKVTMGYNQACAERLVEFFGAETKLAQFTITHFEHYQQARSKVCGPSAINHELQFLSRLLNRVDLWHTIKRHYLKLKEKEWKAPRIFTEDEQARIFSALATEPDLELARIVFTLTRNTTASGCELRGLRLQGLELDATPPRIHITRDSTKNSIRPRTIPLNDAALAACRDAVTRAGRLGSHYPIDYLFPLRIDRATWDPKRRTSKSWLRKQVERLRLVTGIENINPHTFRHLAVTELLERGASEQTVVAIAGWASQRMFATYSHPRMEAKAEAVGLLGPDRKSPHPAVPRLNGTQDISAPQSDLFNPLIQAEIARQVALQRERDRAGIAQQVALALQRAGVERCAPVDQPQPAKGPRLIRFPGAG